VEGTQSEAQRMEACHRRSQMTQKESLRLPRGTPSLLSPNGGVSSSAPLCCGDTAVQLENGRRTGDFEEA